MLPDALRQEIFAVLILRPKIAHLLRLYFL